MIQKWVSNKTTNCAKTFVPPFVNFMMNHYSQSLKYSNQKIQWFLELNLKSFGLSNNKIFFFK